MLVRAGTSIPILDTSHHPALRVAAATPRAAMRQSAILALSVCCSQDFTGVKVGLEELDIATIAIKRLVQRFVVEWIRQTIVWIVKWPAAILPVVLSQVVLSRHVAQSVMAEDLCPKQFESMMTNLITWALAFSLFIFYNCFKYIYSVFFLHYTLLWLLPKTGGKCCITLA